MLKKEIEISIKKFDSDKKASGKYYLAKDYPEAINFLAALPKKMNFIEIQQSAATLMRFLSPAVTMQFISDQQFESQRIDDKNTFLINHLPDVIFIPGNNDLAQLDHLIDQLSLLKKSLVQANICEHFSAANEILASIPIVISGKGGHGVTQGPIFATTEAHAMGYYLFRRLMSHLNIANPIYLENEATNSGANVDFTKKFMREIAAKQNKKKDGLNIWLVPTPVGGIRQLLTVTKQSHQKTKLGGDGYQINQVFMLPNPEIHQHYFKENDGENAGINLFAALRETVNFLNYLLNNDFMSANIPDRKSLENAIETTIFCFEKISGQKVSFPNKLKRLILEIAVTKEKKGTVNMFNQDDSIKINFIKKHFTGIISFFQNCFVQIERQHMDYLPNKLKVKNIDEPSVFLLNKQENFLLPKKSFFNRYHLIGKSVELPSRKVKLSPFI